MHPMHKWIVVLSSSISRRGFLVAREDSAARFEKKKQLGKGGGSELTFVDAHPSPTKKSPISSIKTSRKRETTNRRRS